MSSWSYGYCTSRCSVWPQPRHLCVHVIHVQAAPSESLRQLHSTLVDPHFVQAPHAGWDGISPLSLNAISAPDVGILWLAVSRLNKKGYRESCSRLSRTRPELRDENAEDDEGAAEEAGDPQ